jgi:hypothetical protein
MLRLKGASLSRYQKRSLLFAGYLLRRNGLAFLLLRAVGLGLLLSGVLIYGFGGLVAHIVQLSLMVSSPAASAVSPKGTPACLRPDDLANVPEDVFSDPGIGLVISHCVFA